MCSSRTFHLRKSFGFNKRAEDHTVPPLSLGRPSLSTSRAIAALNRWLADSRYHRPLQRSILRVIRYPHGVQIDGQLQNLTLQSTLCYNNYS